MHGGGLALRAWVENSGVVCIRGDTCIGMVEVGGILNKQNNSTGMSTASHGNSFVYSFNLAIILLRVFFYS